MRSPMTALSDWRRERAQTDRPAIVRRLKKASELAQGFCLTFFIILLLAVAVFAVSDVRRMTSVSDGEWGDRATAVERLYVAEPGAMSNPFGLPFAFGETASAVSASPRDDGLAVTETAPLPDLVKTLTVGGFELALLALGARFFGRIAKTGEPFRRKRARELGAVGVLMVVMSFAPGILLYATMRIGVALLQSSWPIAYGIDAFSYGLLACGLLVLAFAKVFEYGCILQQQDDELI